MLKARIVLWRRICQGRRDPLAPPRSAVVGWKRQQSHDAMAACSWKVPLQIVRQDGDPGDMARGMGLDLYCHAEDLFEEIRLDDLVRRAVSDDLA